LFFPSLFFFFFFFNKSTAGFESLSILENLETLDLIGNYFDRTIFESLTVVKSLKNLNLAMNRITGSFPTQGMLIFRITL
jgi:hypothetical protein